MILTGDQFALYVETAVAGTFVIVNDMNRCTIQSARARNSFAVFQAAPHLTLGRSVKSFSLQGFLNNGDAGQDRLRAMEIAGTPVKIRVLPDGVNGMEVTVLLHSKSYEASAEEATLQPIGFDCENTTTPTNIGSGIQV